MRCIFGKASQFMSLNLRVFFEMCFASNLQQKSHQHCSSAFGVLGMNPLIMQSMPPSQQEMFQKAIRQEGSQNDRAIAVVVVAGGGSIHRCT